MDYYSQYFGLDYPFSKLDFIFVPDISYEALSTQGCMSFKEKFLNPITLTDRILQQCTILHEIVHQWFGNLTTMKWWDDLWIIESMAVYMANRGMDHDGKQRFKKEEKTFDLIGYQYAAAKADMKMSTSSIVCDGTCKDMTGARKNTNMITYGKGAAFQH